MKVKNALTITVLAMMFLIGSLIGREFLLGFASPAKVKVDQLAWLSSNGLRNNLGGNYLPIENIDYTENNKTFSEGYIVVAIRPLNGFSDAQTIIFHKTSTGYIDVLGPANQFTQQQISFLPYDLTKYLKDIGVINRES